jgi:tetratricopeptide (TPR) repeat protein
MERTSQLGRDWLSVAIWAVLGGGCGLAQSPPTSPQRGPELYRSGNCMEAVATLQAPGAGTTTSLALARCYTDAGDYSRALDALTAYRSAVPSDVTAVSLMAQVLLKLNRGEEAAPLVETFLAQYPEEIPVRDALGDVWASLGQSEKAVEQYKKVLEAWPDDPGAHIGLAELAGRERRWQDVLIEFGKARAVVPNHFRVLAGLGAAYVQLGNCAEAVGPLRQALNLTPDNLAVAKSLAKCSLELQRWQDVLSSLQTGSSQEAADEEATSMVAAAFQALRNADGAEAYYRAVIKKNPSNVTAHVELGDILFDDSKRRTEAREEYSAAVKLRPDLSARIHERLGDLADGPNKNADARLHYEAAVRQKDATDAVRWKLAQICFDLPDRNCSEQALTQIKSPEYEARVKALRARIAFAAKDLDRAGNLANEVIAASPGQPDLEILRIAAEVARQKNDPRKAAELYERPWLKLPIRRGGTCAAN